MATLNELKSWLEQGGKIKRSVWSGYIYYLHCGVFINGEENSKELNAEEVFATDWEKVEESERWVPAYREKYYYVNTSCAVLLEEWEDLDFDYEVFNTYNCFKTEKEAKQARDLWLAERELRSLSDGGDWCILYDVNFKGFRTFTSTTSVWNRYLFSSLKKANQAIKQLGEEKLKLIFGVK